MIWRIFKVLPILVLFAPSVFACSFAAGYEVAEPSPEWLTPDGPVPKKPDVKIVSLERGYDDGNFASCSDAGILTIEVAADEGIAGYHFRVVSGEFPDEVFPDYYVTPIKLEKGLGFRFVWLDVPPGITIARSIDATVEVTQITNKGQESPPTEIKIYSAGKRSR